MCHEGQPSITPEGGGKTEAELPLHESEDDTIKLIEPESYSPSVVTSGETLAAETHEGSPLQMPYAPREQQVYQAGPGSIAVGNIGGDVYISPSRDTKDQETREIFISSIRQRDSFIGTFLNQALQQANITFRFSLFFTTAGGLIVIGAAILAITRFAGSPSHGIALVSGIAGILISTSGAAFSVRADKARKHLAKQASVMHSELMDERRFSQIVDLLTGIRNPDLNDQARVSLAMKLMGETAVHKEIDAGSEKESKSRWRAKRT
jgi:hypothetical protein